VKTQYSHCLICYPRAIYNRGQGHKGL